MATIFPVAFSRAITTSEKAPLQAGQIQKREESAIKRASGFANDRAPTADDAQFLGKSCIWNAVKGDERRRAQISFCRRR